MQAGLKWTIGKRRQQSCDFLGGEVRPSLLVRCSSVHGHSCNAVHGPFCG